MGYTQAFIGEGPWTIDPDSTAAARVQMLRQIAVAGEAESHVRELADAIAAIVRRSQPSLRDPDAVALARARLALHVAQDLEYRDEGTRERYQSVARTLRFGGNCHDFAPTLVALLADLGITSRIDWDDQPGAPLNHVTVEALLGGRWLPMEPTIRYAHVGEDPWRAAARVGDAEHLGVRCVRCAHLRDASAGTRLVAQKEVVPHVLVASSAPVGPAAVATSPVAMTAARGGDRFAPLAPPDAVTPPARPAALAPAVRDLGQFGPIPLPGMVRPAGAQDWLARGIGQGAVVTARTPLGRTPAGVWERWDVRLPNGDTAHVTFQWPSG